MRFDDFVNAIYKAGWRAAHDAQHTSIRKLWEKLFPVVADLEEQLSDLQKRLDVYRKGISAIDSLIDSSSGVCGLHLNGDIAPWDELRKGGRFDWLTDFDEALAIDAPGQGGE